MSTPRKNVQPPVSINLLHSSISSTTTKAQSQANFLRQIEISQKKTVQRRNRSSSDKNRPPHQHHRRNLSSRRHEKSTNKSNNSRVLKRCASAPALFGGGGGAGVESISEDQGVLFRGKTSWDVLLSTSRGLSQSFQFFEESCCYNKDAKVVVNVTVEGSSGPIRTMVKLGSSVEETIKLVMERYGKEGRRPKLEKGDGAEFELHDSYFSLQCLDNSYLIGDVGSRSFYLRTTKNGSSPSIQLDLPLASASSPSLMTDLIVTTKTDSAPTLHPSFIFLPGFICRKISKFVRRTRKLWRILGCMQS